MATHAPVFPARCFVEIKRFTIIKKKCIKLNNTEIYEYIVSNYRT